MTPPEDPLQQLRTSVYNALIEHYRHTAHVAKQEMDSAQQQSNDYGQNVNRYDSFRTKMMRMRDMYAKQYSQAQSIVHNLQELALKPVMTTVDYGAIVVTDKQRFCISTGAGKFLVPGHADAPALPYYAISTQVPIFKAMKGKQVGDTFLFNGIVQTIRQIC